MKETIISGEVTLNGLRLPELIVKANFTVVDEHAKHLIFTGKVKIDDVIVTDPMVVMKSGHSFFLECNGTRKLIKIVSQLPAKPRRR